MAQASASALPGAVPAQRDGGAPRSSPAGYGPEDFPGCESFHLPASEIDDYDGRLEFWDGETETAWRIPDTPIQHEGPSRLLVRMATRVAALRGSSIESFGSADLVHLDATGRKRWLMQADEMLYLHPERWRRLRGPAIDVEADPLPDVVLEVDHSTDVRKRKLGFYKESGFPEVWVLVPWEASVRAPGLTIHVRRGEVYREEATSRAFPGWRAEEIHRALTEDPISAGAVRALERVALAMGEREGTRPEDDPFTRTIILMAEARGRAKGREEGREAGRAGGRADGREEGREAGYADGRTEMLEANVRAVLKARGIEAALDAAEDRALFDGLSGDALMAAALACTCEADFRRRIREAAG